jgi:outer membrane protein OmpA-like peptidoglycan-associated protein
MPGGFGGKDIYMSRKSGITWTKPVNLGPEINTSGEEMFPSIRMDGTLFFSSNGLAGFGGLDIFSASKNDNIWVVTRNEGLPLNSNMDDFGISFENDTSGYFTSNREGGKGNDDIYAFKFVNKSTSYSGLLLLTKNINNPAKNTKILLKDDYGRLVDSVYSAENGAFTFNNLNTDVKYLMLLDEDDPSLAGKSRYYIATKDGVIMLVSGKNGIDRYVFKNLPMDVNTLPDLFADNDPIFNVTLAGNVLYDDKGTSKPVRNTHLKMVNDYGDIVESAMSNEFGAFVFRNVPGDQNYIISMDEKDVSLDLGTRVFLTNKDGKELQSFYFGKGKENFKILNADKTMMKDMKVDDAELLVAFNGFLYDSDKKPIPNAKVQMREEGSDRSFYATTDQNGNFKFKNLDADKNYIFESADDDPALAGMKKIFLGDKNGKIYKVLNLNNGKFNYKIIEPDKYAMADFEVDDPWLQALDLKNSGKTSGAALTIVESILYASGDYQPDAPGQKILDKVSTVLASNTKLTIEIISHTDSKASDVFNLTLSKKRAQTAVDYIASKGIDIKRLKSIGLGETKLLNRCGNGVTCSDEEHKINRRTEFKISESVKK